MSRATDEVVTFTTAPAGTGKTLVRCSMFFSEYFFSGRDYEGMHIWTNCPINLDAFCEYTSDRHGITQESIRERIHFLDPELLEQWALGKSSPREFFREKKNCYILLDEVHHYINESSPKPIVEQWKLWLGAIRHDLSIFEGLSQDSTKIHKTIRKEAAAKRFLFNDQIRADPYFKIRLADWYELRAGLLTGEYIPGIWQEDYAKINEKDCRIRVNRYPLDPKYFPFYNSYSAVAKGQTDSKPVEHPFQYLGKFALIKWFYFRNWYSLTWRMAAFIFCFWLCFGGGLNLALAGMQKLIKASYNAQAGHKKIPDVETDAHLNAADKPTIINDYKDLSKKYEAEEKVLNDKIKELSDKLETAQKEIARTTEIVMLSHDQVTLRSGLNLSINETIPSGPYKSQKINEINYAKRQVLLSDGTVLFLVR